MSTATKNKPRVRRKKLEVLEEQLQVKQLQRAIKWMEEADNSVHEDPDEKEWSLLLGAAEKNREVSQKDLDDIRSKCQQLAMTNPHAKRILRNFVCYIVGKQGMTFTPNVEEPGLSAKATEVWRKWCLLVRWHVREGEIVFRLFRDGEVFLHFTVSEEGLEVRFLDASKIQDPSGDHTYGIETDPDDVEKVVNYYYLKTGETVAEAIPADEVLHIKINTDMDVKRGLPSLLPVMDRLRQYDTWIRDRLILNKVRSAIAIVKYWAGSGPSKLAAYADSKKTSTRTDPKSQQSERRRRIKGGTIIDAPTGVKYEMLSPNLQAADVQHDGRSFLLSISAGVGQTEPMVTADASNANYSSTMIAEAAPVKEFENHGRLIGGEFSLLWHRVMAWGEENDNLDPKIREAGVTVEQARIVSRDRDKDIRADEILLDNRVLSPQEVARRDNAEYEKMQQEWQEHDEAYGREPEEDEMGRQGGERPRGRAPAIKTAGSEKPGEE